MSFYMSLVVHCFSFKHKLTSQNIFIPYKVQLFSNFDCHSKVQNLEKKKKGLSIAI